MKPPFEASIAKMVIMVPCRALPPLDACVSKKNPTDSSKTFNEKVEEWGRILNLPKKVETSLYSDRIWCLTRKSLWFDIFGVQTADTPIIGMSFLTLWDDSP